MSAPHAPQLRLFRPPSAAAALGLAVSHLMTKPAFANLKFGDWSRVLTGQINRGHYCFVVDATNQVQGFMGWALATEDDAEDWVESRRPLTFEASKAGDCMVINAWSANNNAVTRFLLTEARRLARDKRTIYFKRHYKDGGTRPARVAVNAFVRTHLARAEQNAA